MVRHFEILLGIMDKSDVELNFASSALAMDKGVSLVLLLPKSYWSVNL